MQSAFTAILAAAFTALSAAPAAPAEVHVAVAANFAEAARRAAAEFARETGHRAVLSFGSTGQLYAQITQHAPYEVFLAADAQRPSLAVAEGYGITGTVFTYATGRLALFSAVEGSAPGEDMLRAGDFMRIAIADPATAPYGAAAMEAIGSLGLLEALRPKIVQGQNVAQAYQFVATGNAELGFVALGQAMAGAGSFWIVPQALYTPVRQDAVLLAAGKDNPAAFAFLDFLRGPRAAEILGEFGYGPGTER